MEKQQTFILRLLLVSLQIEFKDKSEKNPKFAIRLLPLVIMPSLIIVGWSRSKKFL